ncbi:hypothetical protein ACJMK2_024510 [Sinanodonta woodiana]|uniref:Uncharacterized protein n=1 Tax=Sinanodonta woodiana TaxID=1069815 RepID=A0ABD3XDK6_SINWO
MAKVKLIALLAMLLQINNVFSQNPGSCHGNEVLTRNTCLGFTNQQCPLGQKCRNIPGSSLGVCCMPSINRDICPPGSVPTGRTCRAFAVTCPSDSFCMYIPNTSYGYCCAHNY